MVEKDLSRINLCVIGCTGSVGSSVMEICRLYPERFRVISLAAKYNVDKMIELVREFSPERLVMSDPESALRLKSLLPSNCGTDVMTGNESLVQLVEDPYVSHVVFASSGTNAILALKRSIELDLDISLANKESIVLGGPWIMPLVHRKDQIRPLDSEHNAVWQCIMNENKKNIKKIYLTASGGPFLNLPLNKFKDITPAKALEHPVWRMGSKISIDSATLMNKGIELMEAMYLFDLEPQQVCALVHPDAFIHAMVEFKDNTLKMSASIASMKIPAAVCLAYPDRLDLINRDFKEPSLFGKQLTFLDPDLKKFPCLGLAKKAMISGGPYPALVLGADEGAVKSFLSGKIGFLDIYSTVEAVVSGYSGKNPDSIQEAVEIFELGRKRALDICSGNNDLYCM